MLDLDLSLGWAGGQTGSEPLVGYCYIVLPDYTIYWGFENHIGSNRENTLRKYIKKQVRMTPTMSLQSRETQCRISANASNDSNNCTQDGDRGARAGRCPVLCVDVIVLLIIAPTRPASLLFVVSFCRPNHHHCVSYTSSGISKESSVQKEVPGTHRRPASAGEEEWRV